MISCEDALAALFLGSADEMARAHLDACAACRAATAGSVAAGRALREHAERAPVGPPAGLRERTLRAAAPLLREHGVAARRARAVAGLRLCAAPALALALLPLVVWIDFALVTALYDLLSSVLPRGIDLYLTATYAIFLAGLLAAAYASLPWIVARQRGSLGGHGLAALPGDGIHA